MVGFLQLQLLCQLFTFSLPCPQLVCFILFSPLCCWERALLDFFSLFFPSPHSSNDVCVWDLFSEDEVFFVKFVRFSHSKKKKKIKCLNWWGFFADFCRSRVAGESAFIIVGCTARKRRAILWDIEEEICDKKED